MDITVSSPGSPGTSFTDNVKDQIVLLFNELENNEDFNSFGRTAQGVGKSWCHMSRGR